MPKAERGAALWVQRVARRCLPTPLCLGSLCPLPEFRLNAVIPSSGLSGVPSIFMMLQAKINT